MTWTSPKMRLLIRLNAMSALWKQCQQGSSNEGWACERADHLQSTMASYSHSVSFIHQQRDGLEFGSKGYRFALPCVEMCHGRIDGLLQAHYFQPPGRLRNPRAHDSWSV